MIRRIIKDSLPIFFRFFNGRKFCNFTFQLDVCWKTHEKFPGEFNEDGRLVAEEIEESFEVGLRICQNKLRVLAWIVVFVNNQINLLNVVVLFHLLVIELFWFDQILSEVHVEAWNF